MNEFLWPSFFLRAVCQDVKPTSDVRQWRRMLGRLAPKVWEGGAGDPKGSDGSG